MAEALALVADVVVVVVVVDFIADGSDFGASDFIVSEAAGGGVVALGLGLGLEDEGDCARADESINPLSAVVTNNFFSIEKPPWMGCRMGDGGGHGCSCAVCSKAGPPDTNV
jgi:hypothetical protein